ncbi:hypothetical protein [Streptomyces sp. NPDC021096]|uniref:hypothetical protein n=1 Tax=Streptomyces sp. NPDC021096 TaxID=3154792 RepID=UPI003400FA2A
MITPPPAGPPPYPPGPAYPPLVAVTPSGNRRAVVAGIIAAVILVLAGGGAAAWWLTRDDAPLAGRPRVVDNATGLSYAIPEGWKQKDQGGLINAFTSMINTEHADDTNGSVVLAGRAGTVPESELQRTAERAARSNAEFFYPDGSSTREESRPTRVSGRPAHTVVMKTNDGHGHTGHLRLTLISVPDGRSSFLLGIAQSAGPTERRNVDTVLESAAVK